MSHFDKRLKELRLRKNLSIRELAQKVGVPESTYRQWENGTAIKGEPYADIAKALEVSLIELMTGRQPSLERVRTRIVEIKDRLTSLEEEIFSLL